MQIKSNQILVFEERENRSTRRKTSRCRVENQQTWPTYDTESGNQTWATLVGGECSHRCAIPVSGQLKSNCLLVTPDNCEDQFSPPSVKEPTHYSRRVGDGVPGAVAVLFSPAEVAGLAVMSLKWLMVLLWAETAIKSKRDFAECWNK